MLLPVSKDDEGIYSLLGILTSEAADMPLICLLSDDDEEEALKLIQYGAAEVIFASEITPDTLARVTGRVRARALKGGQLQSKMSDFVLTNSFDGIVALDLHGRVMLWNRSMERMFSKKRHEVLGKIATDVLPFEGIAREIKRIRMGYNFHLLYWGGIIHPLDCTENPYSHA